MQQNSGDGQQQQNPGQGDPGAGGQAGAPQGDPGAGQQGGQSSGGAGDGGNSGAQQQSQQTQDPEDTAGLKSALDKERASSRSAIATQRELQKKLDDAQKRLAAIDDAQKDELTKATEAAEREKTRAEAAEARARQTTLRYEIARFATAANFRDPEDAYLMLDTAKIEFGDDGEPKDVEKLVKDLATARPYLLKEATGQQPDGQQGTPGQAPRPTPASALTGQQTPPDVDERYKQEQLRQTRTMI